MQAGAAPPGSRRWRRWRPTRAGSRRRRRPRPSAPRPREQQEAAAVDARRGGTRGSRPRPASGAERDEVAAAWPAPASAPTVGGRNASGLASGPGHRRRRPQRPRPARTARRRPSAARARARRRRAAATSAAKPSEHSRNSLSFDPNSSMASSFAQRGTMSTTNEPTAMSGLASRAASERDELGDGDEDPAAHRAGERGPARWWRRVFCCSLHVLSTSGVRRGLRGTDWSNPIAAASPNP